MNEYVGSITGERLQSVIHRGLARIAALDKLYGHWQIALFHHFFDVWAVYWLTDDANPLETFCSSGGSECPS